MNDRPPVLPGFPGEPVDGPHDWAPVYVWCYWCVSFHQHGFPTGTGAGETEHRVAHCWAPGGPYRSTGYRIKISSTPYSSARVGRKRLSPSQREIVRAGRTTDAINRLREQRIETEDDE